MPQQLKPGKAYPTINGVIKTGLGMYGLITSASFDFVNSTCLVTMKLYEDEACCTMGNSPFSIVSKICTIADYETYFSTIEGLCVTYWDEETTNINAGTYIRADWETIE